MSESTTDSKIRASLVKQGLVAGFYNWREEQQMHVKVLAQPRRESFLERTERERSASAAKAIAARRNEFKRS